MNKIDVTLLSKPYLRLMPESTHPFVYSSQPQGNQMPDTQNVVGRKRLSVHGLTHSYGGQNAVSDVSFDVEAGEIVALLGPSGCGKSTVLRAIAGLIQPKTGKIVLGEKDLANVSARSRGVGMVFQNYALFPHLTVAENIAYPLACQQIPRAERRARVEEMLSLVRLGGYGNRLPRSCRADSSSASPLRERLQAVRHFCCSTSPSALSIGHCVSICRSNCFICRRRSASRRSSSRTIRKRRKAWQTGWCS